MGKIGEHALPGGNVDIEFLDLCCYAFALEDVIRQIHLGVDLDDILHAADDVSVETEILFIHVKEQFLAGLDRKTAVTVRIGL